MGKQKRLSDDWADKVPAPVQEAADGYIQALSAKGRAHGKFNTAREALISAMRKGKCSRVRVTYKDSEKIIQLEELDKLKVRKPEEPEGQDERTKITVRFRSLGPNESNESLTGKDAPEEDA